LNKIAYFDCFSGISGDMVLGALLDLGLEPERLREVLRSLPVSGYRLEIGRERRGAIMGTRCRVALEDAPQEHRRLADINAMIEASSLEPSIKEQSKAIFARLAQAEANVHGICVEQVHFHEVGAVDAIVDVVGSAAALQLLGVSAVHASRLPLGQGMISCRHGSLPLPAPATLRLLQGVPVYDNGVRRELVTPTGAAILTTLAHSYGQVPDMTLLAAGYGVGADPASEPPNLLRVLLGTPTAPLVSSRLLLLETQIDDMNPEFYDYVMERLFAFGVRDVTLIPMQMKKNRPAVLLRVLLEHHLRQSVVECLFAETTTLGVRFQEVERVELRRAIETIATPYGPMRVKWVDLPGGKRQASPEYEDCKAVARRTRVPLRSVYAEVIRLAERCAAGPDHSSGPAMQ
jgi:pyridinium-3,5-bisthiocarboxylic acid mononucleotide nickel chelatase